MRVQVTNEIQHPDADAHAHGVPYPHAHADFITGANALRHAIAHCKPDANVLSHQVTLVDTHHDAHPHALTILLPNRHSVRELRPC